LQLSSLEVDMTEDCSDKLGLAQLRSFELSPDEPSALKIGASKVE
jgi:hypothetical protein